MIPKKSPTLTTSLRREWEAACLQRGQHWLTAGIMHYLPAIPMGVLRRAGFPEGVAGRPSISVSIVLCCLLVGCEGMAHNNIPDVPCGRNCVTQTHSGVFLAAPAPPLGTEICSPHHQESPSLKVSAAALLTSTCGLLVNYPLSCGFLLSSRGRSEEPKAAVQLKLEGSCSLDFQVQPADKASPSNPFSCSRQARGHFPPLTHIVSLLFLF